MTFNVNRQILDLMRPSQTEDITSSLLALRQHFSEEKVTLRELLSPYNRLNRSYIQENDFLRALKPYPTAPIVAKAYSSNGIISINEVEKALSNVNLQPPEPPKTPPYIIFTLARQFQRQNVDYWSIFTLNDRLRIGKYDVTTFASLLSQTGVRIGQDDLNTIIDFYRVQEKVNYLAFLEDIRKAGIAEQEVIRNRKSCGIDEPDIHEIINQIKRNCYSRRVSLSGFFEGYKSPMTFYTFTRIINNANLQLNSREINFLAQYCQIGNGSVDPSIIISKVDQLPATSTALSDANNVVSKIKKFLDERQIYLTPRFEKFDREKSGEFPASLVNSVLSQFELPLSDYEIDCIQQKYPGSRTPFIKWHDFDADIESESVVSKYQQMQTMRRMNESTPKPKLSSSTSSNLFKPIESTQQIKTKKDIPDYIQPTLIDIANYEIRNSMNIFDDLREIDSLKLGFIQPYQFNSYILTLFPRMSNTVINDLIQYYGNKEFLYIDLCKDVDDIRKSINSGSLNLSGNFSQQNYLSTPTTNKFASTAPITPINSAENNDPEFDSLVKRLKAFTVKSILSPIEIFRINDNTGLGYVLSRRLQNCFSLVRFHITQSETNLLLKKYCHRDYPDRFYYLPLVKILDDMKMDAEEVKWTLAPDLAQNQIDDSAHSVNCQIHGKLIARRKTITDYFIGCPRAQPIDIKEFTNRIGKIDIVLEPFELQVLITKYKNSQDESKINWESFCNDVHNAKLF